jgi:hypothetical protein
VGRRDAIVAAVRLRRPPRSGTERVSKTYDGSDAASPHDTVDHRVMVQLREKRLLRQASATVSVRAQETSGFNENARSVLILGWPEDT